MLAVVVFYFLFLTAGRELFPLQRHCKDLIERTAPLQTYQERRAVALICSSRPNQACGRVILLPAHNWGGLFLHLFPCPRLLLLWLGSRPMCCDAFKCGAVGQSVSLCVRGPWCRRGDICLRPKGEKQRRFIREPVILTPSCFCPLLILFNFFPLTLCSSSTADCDICPAPRRNGHSHAWERAEVAQDLS